MEKDENEQQLKQAGRLSLQALTWLRDNKVPARPVPYTVAFEFQDGSAEELHNAVAEIPPQDLSVDQLELIFKEYILPRYIDVEKLNQSVEGLVDTAGEAIFETHETLDDYSEVLDDAIEVFHSVENDLVNKVLNNLLNGTKNVSSSVSALQDTLNVALAEMKQLQKNYVILKQQTKRDELTGVLNRTSIQEAFKTLVSDSANFPICLAVADIDHFKSFNDKYGHSVGDKVLRLVAQTLKKHLKGSDPVSRYGGEEFVILLPATTRENAQKLLSQLCEKIGSLTFVNKSSNNHISGITMSMGVSEVKIDDSFYSVFDRADKALYISKKSGRNRVSSS